MRFHNWGHFGWLILRYNWRSPGSPITLLSPPTPQGLISSEIKENNSIENRKTV